MEGAGSVLHEVLFIVSVYASMRAMELLLSAETRYHSKGNAGVMRVISLLCMLLFGLYALLGAAKVLI